MENRAHSHVREKKQSLIHSFRNAFLGIALALRERNFRIQVAVGTLALVGAIYLPLTTTERIFIIILIGFVLSAELLNSSIEYVLDILVQEHHADVARAKDIAAGAVLVVSMIAASTGLWIFIEALKR